MSAKDVTLIVCNMQNKFMDPGYPPFLYTGSEIKQMRGIKGALDLVPRIYSLARAIVNNGGNVYFQKSRTSGIKKEIVVPLDKIKGCKESDINKTVYVCGLFQNHDEFMEFTDRYNRKFLVSDLHIGAKTSNIQITNTAQLLVKYKSF